MKNPSKSTGINPSTSSGLRVLVAMSGGVDSSVAAALLKEQGYDLIGVTMALACTQTTSDKSCCSQAAANDAKKVADALNIPHYTLNLKDDFQKLVIDDFIAEYRAGHTPNPCVRCNQFIKFDLLLKKARELGANLIATGHYAKILKPSPRNPLPLGEGIKLLKGDDRKKDQSYFLYTLNQQSLAQTMFPLGEMTKTEVRKLAKKFKLAVAEKKESQEICFVENDDYAEFLRQRAPELVKPGDIVDKNGKVVGRHQGVAFYTIGQRKGVGAHKGEPKYVIGINNEKNEVIIGADQDLLRAELLADNISFVSGEWPAAPLEVTAKIRYNSIGTEAVIYPQARGQRPEAKVKVVFKRPQRAVTPGQSVVFYKGDEVFGGGIIS